MGGLIWSFCGDFNEILCSLLIFLGVLSCIFMHTTQLISLDTRSLVADARLREDFDLRQKAVLNEVMASNGKVILFIDEFHTRCRFRILLMFLSFLEKIKKNYYCTKNASICY